MKAYFQIVSVIVPLNLSKAYSYNCSYPVEIGSIVKVSFGKKIYNAIVIKIEESTVPQENLKNIEQIYELKFKVDFLRFMQFFADYTLTPLGLVADIMLRYFNLETEFKQNSGKTITCFKNILSIEQKNIASELIKLCDSQQHTTILLEGVTGCGKTEIYFEAIERALKKNQQILVLLPEISLTKQFLERFEKTFGFKAHSWNSGISKKSKKNIWTACEKGIAKVVIGVRSAIFLPFDNLGLIIVDEEHDSSYKQEENIFYQARDMAIARANFASIPVILSTATPSVETMVNVQNGKYKHLILKQRFNNIKLPKLHLIDLNTNLKSEKGFLSDFLLDKLKQNLIKQQQSILFLGRRGYAPLTLCKNCGYRITCPNCSVYMVKHNLHKALLCHYCGHREKLPNICPQCEEEPNWLNIGCGVERIYEEVQEKIPQARVLILSTDLIGNIKNLREQIKLIEEYKIDIIIGTQLISKGHNFSNVSLVGVINADLTLHNGDPRACERTYQTIMQVTGRAGRTGLESIGIIQTYNPEHPTLNSIIKGELEQFYQQEIAQRKYANIPPFSRFAAIIISGSDDNLTKLYAKSLRQKMPNYKNIEIFGPAQAPIAFLCNKYRYRILIKASKTVNLQCYLKNIINEYNKNFSKINLQIDIDPQSFF